jgi:predicted O-linked N-acetylglucosamine transferase (SPINDLY family)
MTPALRRKRQIRRQLRRAFRQCSHDNFGQAKNILEQLLPHESNNSSISLLRGMVALKEKRASDALRALTIAAEAKPDSPMREFYLGVALERCGEIEEAATQYRWVLELNANYLPAINNLSRILGYADLDEALELCERGLRLAPRYAALNATMGHLQLHAGNAVLAAKYYRQSLKYRPQNSETRSGLIFSMNYFETGVQQLLEEERKWERILAKSSGRNISKNIWDLLNLEIPTHPRKLRIGYLSGDFRRHSVSFFIDPLLRCHDKKHFDIYCYSDVEQPDDVTEAICQKASCWRDISRMSNGDVYKQIKKDHVDILVDLFGHTAGRRMEIFGLRAAPVQISYLGYPGSTGLKNIDFRIGDRFTDPERLDQFFPEELIRLQNGFWAYSPPAESPKVGPLPCLKNGYFTFGSFNNQAKITPDVIEVWSRILEQNYSARLLIKNSSLASESVRDRVWEQFEQNGITPGRVMLRPFTPSLRDHLDGYNEVDVALDTFPYNGTTTTFEALWMGVPVLTMVGERHASRVGNAILSRLNLQEFITGSYQSYIRTAADMPDRLKDLIELRKGLRKRLMNSPFCDHAARTAELEKAFRSAYSSYLMNVITLRINQQHIDHHANL